MTNIPHLIKYKRRLIALCLLLISFHANSIQLTPLSGTEYVGDLAELEKKRVLRVLVAADLGFYYIEDGITKGIIADLLQHFEKDIHKKHPSLHLQIILPVHRDNLLPYVINGFRRLSELLILLLQPNGKKRSPLANQY